jgi:transcriptional regulator with XRE-family HTH domain
MSEQRLTQEDVAKRLKVDRSLVSKILTGSVSRVGPRTRPKLARLLGCTEEELRQAGPPPSRRDFPRISDLTIEVAASNPTHPWARDVRLWLEAAAGLGVSALDSPLNAVKPSSEPSAGPPDAMIALFCRPPVGPMRDQAAAAQRLAYRISWAGRWIIPTLVFIDKQDQSFRALSASILGRIEQQGVCARFDDREQLDEELLGRGEAWIVDLRRRQIEERLSSGERSDDVDAAPRDEARSVSMGRRLAVREEP